MFLEEDSPMGSVKNDRVPPTIAHVVFRLDYGGMENGLVNLINKMPPDAYRHAIICLTEYTNFRKRIQRAHVPVYALHKQRGKDLSMYVRLWRTLRELSPDIVHTRNIGTLDSVIPAILAGVRCFIHGEHGIDISSVSGEKRRYAWYRRVHAPFIQRFVAVAPNLEILLRQQIGEHRKKIILLRNGVDTKQFYPSGGSREPLPVDGFASESDFVIGSVGRLDPVKDPKNLIFAFLRLLDTMPAQKLKLVFVGDGSLRPEIFTILRRRGVEKFVWLPGSRNDVSQILRGIDLFVLPSRAEGMSNSILEAMATSLPIVATAVGGNSQLVEHGVTGVLVPAEDPSELARQIQWYMINPDKRRLHGMKGREKAVREFSIDTTVGAYQRIYDEVLISRAKVGKQDQEM